MVFDVKNARKRPAADNNFIRLDSGVLINRFDRNYYTQIIKHEREITANTHEHLAEMFEQDGAVQKAFFHFKLAIRKSVGQQAEEIEQTMKRLLKRGFVDKSPDFRAADERLESYIRIAKWAVVTLLAINVILLLMNWIRP